MEEAFELRLLLPLNSRIKRERVSSAGSEKAMLWLHCKDGLAVIGDLDARGDNQDVEILV